MFRLLSKLISVFIKKPTYGPPTKVVAPQGCDTDYLTIGEVYHVIEGSQVWFGSNLGYRFEITDDQGDTLVCSEFNSPGAHDVMKTINWIVKERKPAK